MVETAEQKRNSTGHELPLATMPFINCRYAAEHVSLAISQKVWSDIGHIWRDYRHLYITLLWPPATHGRAVEARLRCPRLSPSRPLLHSTLPQRKLFCKMLQLDGAYITRKEIDPWHR